MFRVLIFARRKPDLSREAFIAIYEKSHIDLVNDLVRSGLHKPMITYRRHYLLRDHPFSTQAEDLNFDVVVESEFASLEDYSQTMQNIAASPETLAMVNANFDKFLDLSSLRYLVVETHSGGGEG